MFCGKPSRMELGVWGIGILTRTVGDGLMEKVTFKQRLGGAEGLIHRHRRKGSRAVAASGVGQGMGRRSGLVGGGVRTQLPSERDEKALRGFGAESCRDRTRSGRT